MRRCQISLRPTYQSVLAILVSLACCVSLPSWAQDASADTQETDVNTADANEEMAELYAAFEKQMSACKMTGRFSIDGQDGELKEESYEIKSVKKLTGDTWLFNVRIRYGDHDVTVPLPLPVIWAGKTPVITVDNVAIPGLGTFDARVVIADGKYAGTWQHGKVGGHLFGKIVSEQTKDETAESVSLEK